MLEYLTAAPALVKLLGAFASILVAARMKLHLGGAMLLGALVLALWTPMPAAEAADSLFSSVTDKGTWSLVFLVILIVIFGKTLQMSGRLDRVVAGVVSRSGSRKRASALLPALIGLLPMPGGAYLSAPMVEAAAAKDSVSPHRMATINYWFRHLWEYWWPLYPGVIVAVDILARSRPDAINLGWFILFEMPLTPLVFLGGWIFLMGKSYSSSETAEKVEKKPLWGEMTPILVVIGLTLLWSLASFGAASFAPFLKKIPKALPLALFVLIGTVAILWRDNLGAGTWKKLLFQRKCLDMALIIFGVMSFRGIIHDSAVVSLMRDELASLNVPPMALVGALPFVAGIVTGIAIGFVGASFSVVAGLIPPDATPLQAASYYVLAFGAGYTGMMLSPVHFCLILTRDYFKTDLKKIYRLLAGPALFLAACVALLSLFYHILAWGAR